MTDLFAGIGTDGSVRFIGEVARGAACDCRCPECSSPLVARQGQLRSWHFAHEGGQERPECSVGATNLLRRLAIEYLKQRPSLEPPAYRHVINGRIGVKAWFEQVEIESTRVEPWQWFDRPTRRAPAARTRLDDGVVLCLHVEVAEEPMLVENAEVAVLTYVLPLPGVEHLQTRDQLEEHITRQGRFQWVSRPDRDGLVRDAYRRLESARANGEAEQRAAQERSDAAAAASSALADSLATSCGAWAPKRAPNSSFLYYRMPDGSQWVVYTLQNGDAGVISWPPQIQHATPSPIGNFDNEIGVYRASQAEAILYFNSRRGSLRTTSDVRELVAWSVSHS